MTNRNIKLALSIAGRPSFTLIEMMVVMGVMAMIMLGVNIIFGNLSEAVSLGSGQSHVISTARSTSDFFLSDTAGMVGPSENGFIAIRKGANNSDEILFVRRRGNYQPACPANAQTYTPPGSKAPYVLIWYGHATRVDTAVADSAHNKTLGRQVVFLDPSAAGALPDATAVILAGGASDIVAKDLASVANDFAAAPDNYLYAASDNPLQTRRFPFAPDKQPTEADFSPDNIAQMHTHFASQVSEFMVEYAGDANSDGKIDVDAEGSILWTRATVTFKHTTPSAQWPYLIRLRYRVHDVNDKLIGPDGKPGRPLEQVFYVNRM